MRLLLGPYILLLWVDIAYRNSYSTICAIASAGFLGAMLMQQKYFEYHLYPALAFALLSVAFALPLATGRSRFLLYAAFAGIMLQNLNEARVVFNYRSKGGALGQSTQILFSLSRITSPQAVYSRLSRPTRFQVFHSCYANRVWASVSICRIFLPAVVQLRSDPLHEKTDLLRFAEKKAIEDILQDLAKKPAVILIDVAPGVLP